MQHIAWTIGEAPCVMHKAHYIAHMYRIMRNIYFKLNVLICMLYILKNSLMVYAVQCSAIRLIKFEHYSIGWQTYRCSLCIFGCHTRGKGVCSEMLWVRRFHCGSDPTILFIFHPHWQSRCIRVCVI